MGRYYFDVIDGRTACDTVSVDLPDLAAVHREATRLLPEIARDEILRDDRGTLMLGVVVRDEDGQPIYSANLSYAMNWLQRQT